MKASENALSLIKQFEGLEATAYLCPAGVWTIGYGHTQNVTQGQTCTREQADAWLRDDVQEASRAVTNAVGVPLRQGQFDALVSFVFNFGATKFNASTLLAKLNTGDYTGAAGEFGRWINSNGVPSDGLKRRRAAEKALFLS
ncbi:lysozyme [Gibbsiella dentisursi]|uniref:Lysozyme n=1 Tax=Gibbsiella dentisursi TaxID=796890 RepID=A0ABP7M069_9GAMM